MWPRILIGIILFVGIASAASEYDNIPLETSHSAQRRIGQGPFYTATYGVAPGEYVLRGSDEGEAQPAAAPPQGFSFSQRDQPPPQEYLDLLSQAGVTDTDAPQQPQHQHLQHQQQQHQQLQHQQLQHQQLQHQQLQHPQLQHQQLQPQQLHQQSVPSRVVDQQFFGVHTRAPYPAAGTQPVSSLKLPNAPTKYPQHERAQPQPLRTPVQSYPSTHNQVAPSKYDSTPLYVTPLPDTVPVSPKKTKPTPGLSSRKTPAVSRTRPQGDSRQGSGKAVQLTYSLDYDLRTLHKDASSAARASPPPAQYSPTVPGKVVKGDERLLRKLAPEPEPLPFPLSRRGNKKSKTKQPDSSSDYDEDDDQKIEVIKLPKNQRPITQEELNELIRAGYDISPVEEDHEEAQPKPRQESTAPQKPQGYPQPAAPLHQLRLPKSRPVEVQAPRYYTSTKTQAPNFNIPTRTRQNAYASAPAPATGDEDAGYTYHAPRPLPLEPKVQAYQPGRSGIQDVNKHKTAEQTYQEEDESQTQAYLHDYVNQGYPTSAAPQQPLIPQVQNYPTAAAQVQQQPQYHQVPADQAQLYHQQQVAQQEVQVYQHPGTTESRNEALSQPKEYVLPVPQKSNRYHARGHQGYVPTAPSAAGNDGTLTYHQALVHNQQQGYEQATPAAGVSPVSADEFPQTLPQTFPQTTEGYGRRLTQRKPSSLRESRVTYIRRFQGQTTGYSTEH